MVLFIPSYRPHRAARAFVVVWRCRRIYLDLRQAAFLSVSHSVRGRTDGQLQNKKLTWGFWPFFRPLFLSKKQKKWHKRCTEMKWMPFFFAATPAQGKYEIAKMVCFDGAPLTPPFFWGKKNVWLPLSVLSPNSIWHYILSTFPNDVTINRNPRIIRFRKSMPIIVAPFKSLLTTLTSFFSSSFWIGQRLW